MITDRQIASSYIQMYEQGVEKKEVRSYEVSIWTLQDEFITVLKWSDVEQKGRIQDPQLTIADDGTQEFKFSIPMYLYDGERLVENPIWYNTKNGNIAINLRKIKVIFNKQSSDERIFEFLITKVTETHEADKLTCEIECEGLAFHELGRRGYKISLSLDDYDLIYKEWLEGKHPEMTERPKQNVQFWCEKIGLKPLPQPLNFNSIKSSEWYYEIDMHWDFVGGIKRKEDIVYEEPFVKEWDDALNPITVEQLYEKERTIDVHESNIYNITQEIAKQFGIFCRYEYKHDKNNHIIYKKVVFFNNCLHGDDGKELIIGFTYPHSSKKISREIDSKDIVTKMYVRSMEDPSVLLGEANISYCCANKTGEDYILNFDYLKESGNLTDEQLKEIPNYEQDISALNKKLIQSQNMLAEYQRQEIDLEAKMTTYQNSITLDKEQINKNSDLARSLVAEYGDSNSPQTSQYIKGFDNTHPDQGFIVEDSTGNLYINLKTKQKGIDPKSIKLYRNYSSSRQEFSTPIDNFTIVYDEYSNPTAIYGVAKIQGQSNKVYMEYSYEPRLYYENVVKTWQIKLANDQKEYTNVTRELGSEISKSGLKYYIAETKKTIETNLKQKKNVIDKFERIMGPALREGYWQPEKYETYGKHYNDSKKIQSWYSDLFIDTDDSFIIGWDPILFDEELDIKYQSGVEQTEIYYPCINLNTVINNQSIYSKIHSNLFKYSFIFNNNYYQTWEENYNLANISNFSINENRGGQAVFSFVKQNNTIIPVLVLTGAKSMTNEQIEHMTHSAQGKPRLGILNIDTTNGQITSNINSVIELPDECWMSGAMQMVYPRIKFSSLMLKTDPTNLFIGTEGLQQQTIKNMTLEQFEDYYIKTRCTVENEYRLEYLITIKPERLVYYNLINDITVNVSYVLSNASTSIYLDALKIEKENAYPKVSYTVDPNILNKAMIRTLYDKLSWIVHINDAQLKLKDAYGYISKLVLNLDFPDKDTIEVKNYTTKFEDLFSTIVAQTENMQRNEGLLNRLARGEYALSGHGLNSTLNTAEMNNYFDTYFSESSTVQEILQNLFSEAGAILSDSTNVLNQVQSLSLENSTILNGFAERVQNELVPKVFRQVEEPDEFKKGDIWIEIDQSSGNTKNTYLAMFDSDSARPGHGWMKTYDGSLSQIEGAVLNIDAQAGKIDIAAQDVNIVGNQSVNIGGTIINIGSNTINGTAQQGAVNIYATSYDNITSSGLSSSRVLIKPTEIKMAGAKITMLVGTQKNDVSAIELDGSKGIWIGSNKSINMYSNTDGTSGGANVSINPEQIIMGVASGTASSVFEIKPSYLVLASGTTAASQNKNVTLTYDANSTLTGLKITKDSFGLSIGNNAKRTVILMNQTDGVIIGGGITPKTDETTGSFVQISGSGVIIGSSGYLKINTNDMILNSQATDSGVVLQLKNGNTNYLTYTADGKLNITVNSLTIGNNTYNSQTGIKMSNSDIWAAVKSATGSTGLRLTDTSLSMYASGASTSTFNLTSDGISMSGKNISISSGHLLINGQKEWSRDDIIIMKKTPTNPWENSVDNIEKYMNNQRLTINGTVYQRGSVAHDWVLIKPYYNARWSYKGDSIGDTQLMDGNVVTMFTTTYSDSDVFGDNAGNNAYTYTFKIYVKSNQRDDSAVLANIKFKLTSTDGSITRTVEKETDDFTVTSWQWRTFTVTSGTNLLFSPHVGRTITCTVQGINNRRCLVRQAEVIAQCDSTSTRVACTVYYYP